MPAMLANKVSEGKAAGCESCPYVPPTQLFAFLVSHGEFLGIAPCFAAHLSKAVGSGFGEAMSFLPPHSPPPQKKTNKKTVLFINALLHTVGENYLLAYVEIRVLDRYSASGAQGMLAPRHSFSLSYGDGVEGEKKESPSGMRNYKASCSESPCVGMNRKICLSLFPHRPLSFHGLTFADGGWLLMHLQTFAERYFSHGSVKARSRSGVGGGGSR